MPSEREAIVRWLRNLALEDRYPHAPSEKLTKISFLVSPDESTQIYARMAQTRKLKADIARAIERGDHLETPYDQ